jgi:hypothetical protein
VKGRRDHHKTFIQCRRLTSNLSGLTRFCWSRKLSKNFVLTLIEIQQKLKRTFLQKGHANCRETRTAGRSKLVLFLSMLTCCGALEIRERELFSRPNPKPPTRFFLCQVSTHCGIGSSRCSLDTHVLNPAAVSAVATVCLLQP